MNKNTLVNSTNASFFLICLAITQFIMQTEQLTKGTEYIVASLTNDDTYYYLQTAWNTKHLGFVTFDGLHATNGVQFAWFGIVFLLTLLTPTKTTLLFITLTTCNLLNMASYFIIWKIFQILKQPILSVFVAILWLATSFTSTYSSGLDNSFHAFIFWCVIWQVLLFLSRVQKNETPNFLGVTIVLVLNAWVRLDSAVFSAVLYMFCIILLWHSYHNVKSFLQNNVHAIARSTLLAVLGLVIQLGFFWFIGGSFLPISAVVKSSGASLGWGENSLKYLLDILLLSFPYLLPDRFYHFAPTIYGMSMVLATGLLLIRSSTYRVELIIFRQLWFSLLIGVFVYHLVIVFFRISYTPYLIWYRSPLFIFWIITFSFIVFVIQTFYMKGNPNGYTRIVLVLSLSISIVSVFRFIENVKLNEKLIETNFHVMRYRVALWLSENSHPDTIYAAWNTGELAFFSNRTFINLDGLINNIDYYEHVLQSPTPLESLKDYLLENDVNYIVDYVDNELTSSLPVIKAFPRNENSGPWIRIWEVVPSSATWKER